MHKTLLAVGIALCCQAQAEEQSLSGSASIFIGLMSETELSDDSASLDADGTAFGFRGEVGTPTVFAYIDHQQGDQDGDLLGVGYDFDNTETRVGFGVRSDDPTLNFIGRLERYDAESEFSSSVVDDKFEDDGAGVHIGFESKTSDTAAFYASAGYLNLGETDGPEFKFGIKGIVADNVQLFGEYRTLTLEDDVDDDFKLTDVRLGASFMF